MREELTDGQRAAREELDVLVNIVGKRLQRRLNFLCYNPAPAQVRRVFTSVIHDKPLVDFGDYLLQHAGSIEANVGHWVLGELQNNG